MVVVWRGAGLIALIVAGLVGFATGEALKALSGDPQFLSKHSWAITVMGLVSAAALWLIVQRFLDGRGTHDVYFIPIRFWPHIIVGFSVLAVFGRKVPQPSVRPAGAAAADAGAASHQAAFEQMDRQVPVDLRPLELHQRAIAEQQRQAEQHLQAIADQQRQFDERMKESREAHAKRVDDMRKRTDALLDDALRQQREFVDRHMGEGTLHD